MESTTAGKLIRLLEAVAASEDGRGVREVSREIGIDRSATSRLFAQLEALDMVEKSETSGRYRVGPRLFALGATVRARDTLWRAAEPIMQRLVDRFNETCYLATLEHNEIIFQAKIDCDRTIRYVIELGKASPLHAGAGGRAVLLGMTPDEFDAVVKKIKLKALTARTITVKDKLRRQTEKDRLRGYAVSIGERVVGGNAVAAPYFGSDGRCRGSIVFTSPAERFDKKRVPEIAEAVMACARDLSARLGYKPERPTKAKDQKIVNRAPRRPHVRSG